MNQKTIIALIILAIALVVGGAVLSQDDQGSFSGNKTEEKSSSSLVADRQYHDFGTIDIFGGNVETDFILTNNGSEDVVVLAGTTSCGCTEGNLGGIQFGMHEKMSETVTVKAGKSEKLTVIYDPLAHGPSAVGPVTRQVFLKTNSTANQAIEIRISANVVNTQN